MTVGTKRAHNDGLVLHHTEAGTPYYRELEAMPKIPLSVLDCAIYIYDTPDAAGAGDDVGSSGFLVSVHSKFEGEYFYSMYVATCWHCVIDDYGNPEDRSIRLNAKNGGIRIIEVRADSWIRHHAGDDLAVAPLSLSLTAHKFNSVTTSLFLKKGSDTTWIGPGTETVTIGRFMDYDGRHKNTPSVRFGNIAVMEEQAVMNKRLHNVQDSLLVECRTISGYSGSPVFALWSPLAMNDPYCGMYVENKPPHDMMIFLGVTWSYLPSKGEVFIDDPATGDPETPTNAWVKGHTGMAAIIPAWKLRELLESEEVAAMRNKNIAEVSTSAKKKKAALAPVPTSREKTFTKSDFENALKKVSRRVPPSKSGKEKK